MSDIKSVTVDDLIGVVAETEPVETIQRFLKHVRSEKATPVMRALLGDSISFESLGSQGLKTAQRTIIELEPTKRDAYEILCVLTRWIEVGNTLGCWELCAPPLPVFVKAPVSPFADAARVQTACYRDLNQVLLESARKSKALLLEGRPKLQLGELLLSAIVFGDIHDTAGLKALLAQCDEPIRYCHNHAWIDLRLVRQKQPEVELRRWFPDKLTELIFYRLPAETIEHAGNIVTKRNTTSEIFSCISLFLKFAGISTTQIPTSFKAIFSIVSYQRMLDSSAVIAGYSAKKYTSHSLKPYVWVRLLGVKDEKAVEAVESQATVKDDEDSQEWLVESPLDALWLIEYRREVLSDDVTRSQCISKAAEHLEAMSPSGSTRYLIPQWVYFLSTKRAKSKGKLALNTIRGYLSSTAKRLAAAAGELDITSLDEAGFEDIYWLVLEDAESTSLKRSIAKALKEFHHFLVQEYQVPPLASSQALGMGSSRVPVDANILSLDEYEQCLDALQRDRELNTFDVDLARVAALIFIIGFRCGTRRSEVLKLRLADYHPSSRSELLIRPWSCRRLKTKSSTRKLPIHVLLTVQELQMLDDWYNKRCLEEQGGSTDSYLFALPEKMLESIPEEFVFRKIHRVMRAETGDQQLRYHHLRHSFATWTTLRLFLSDLEAIPELFPEQPQTQAWLNQSKQFRGQLYLNADITRKHIYAVASLLGHAGPEMTLEHYVHCMDLVTYISRQERVGVSVLNKAINFATGKLYQYKAHKDGAKLISLARDAAVNTTKKKNARSMVLESDDGVSSNNASGDDKAQATLELGATVLENLNTFLSVYSQQQNKELSSLCARFGYSENVAKRYIKNAEILASKASLRSEKPRFKTQAIYRNGEKFSSLAPYWRLGDADRAEFCDMANRAYVLATSDEVDFESVCKYYINNKWGSQNGLIFHSLRQQEDARSYVDFLLRLGVDEKRIQLSFFKGVNVKVRRRWQSIFNLKRGNVLNGVSPYNKLSKSLSEAVRVKVLAQRESNLHANTETPVIQLLMYLLAVLILGDAGAV